jgi:hypothetical protein
VVSPVATPAPPQAWVAAKFRGLTLLWRRGHPTTRKVGSQLFIAALQIYGSMSTEHFVLTSAQKNKILLQKFSTNKLIFKKIQNEVVVNIT